MTRPGLALSVAPIPPSMRAGNDGGTLEAVLCLLCGRDLPIDSKHWHRDRRSPTGYARRCRDCRNGMDRTRPERLAAAAAQERDELAGVPGELEAARLARAVRLGEPIEGLVKRRPPEVPPPCIGCGRRGCRCLRVHALDVVEGVLVVEAEGELAGRPGRWRGSLERFPDGRIELHVRKRLGSAWVCVGREALRDAFYALAVRARRAWAVGGWAT